MYGERIAKWEKAVEWPLTLAAVLFLAAYAIQIIARPGGLLNLSCEIVLVATWAVFVVDYVVRLAITKRRWRWFYRHLLDLAIVVLPMLRPLRLMRFLTVLALIGRSTGNMLRGRVVLYTVGATVLTVFIAALSVFDAERGVGDIDTFPDAVWWAFVTITTVGYGDYYPVTAAGRIVAVGLMVGGIALIGVVTATLASWIVERVADQTSKTVSATETQVEELRSEIVEQGDDPGAAPRRLSCDSADVRRRCRACTEEGRYCVARGCVCGDDVLGWGHCRGALGSAPDDRRPLGDSCREARKLATPATALPQVVQARPAATAVGNWSRLPRRRRVGNLAAGSRRARRLSRGTAATPGLQPNARPQRLVGRPGASHDAAGSLRRQSTSCAITTGQEYDWMTVDGTVTSNFSEDQDMVRIDLIARNPQGQIVGVDFTFTDRVPAGGTAAWNVSLWEVPLDSTVTAYAHL